MTMDMIMCMLVYVLYDLCALSKDLYALNYNMLLSLGFVSTTATSFLPVCGRARACVCVYEKFEILIAYRPQAPI